MSSWQLQRPYSALVKCVSAGSILDSPLVDWPKLFGAPRDGESRIEGITDYSALRGLALLLCIEVAKAVGGILTTNMMDSQITFLKQLYRLSDSFTVVEGDGVPYLWTWAFRLYFLWLGIIVTFIITAAMLSVMLE